MKFPSDGELSSRTSDEAVPKHATSYAAAAPLGFYDLDDLTREKIVARLESPYDLIAEWTRYVPLGVVLSLHIGMLGLHEDCRDGTVTMNWSAARTIAKDYVVPFELYERTWFYLKSQAADVSRIPGTQVPLIFVAGDRYVTESDFYAAVERATDAERQSSGSSNYLFGSIPLRENDPRVSFDVEHALFREWLAILPQEEVLALKGWDLVMAHTLPDDTVRLEKYPTAVVSLDLWRRTSRFRSLSMDLSSRHSSPETNLVFRRIATHGAGCHSADRPPDE